MAALVYPAVWKEVITGIFACVFQPLQETRALTPDYPFIKKEAGPVTGRLLLCAPGMGGEL